MGKKRKCRSDYSDQNGGKTRQRGQSVSNPHNTRKNASSQDAITISSCEICGKSERVTLAYQAAQIDRLGRILCQTCVPDGWLNTAILTCQPVVRASDMATVTARAVLSWGDYLILRLPGIKGSGSGGTGVVVVYDCKPREIIAAHVASYDEWRRYRAERLAAGGDDITKLYHVQVSKAAVIEALRGDGK